MKLEHDIGSESGNNIATTTTTARTTMSFYHLQELASRQQEQIESTQRLILTKEHRLSYLNKMEDSQQAPLIDYDHSFAQFKEKLALQEAKLRKLRLLKAQIQKQRCSNSKMSSELDTVRVIYREKERELSQAMSKIESLTRQLEELKKGNIANSYNINGYNQHSKEMERLRQELLYKTNMSNQRNEEMMVKQSMLFKRNTEMVKIDKKINELQTRLARKRQMNQQLSSSVTTTSLPSPGSGCSPPVCSPSMSMQTSPEKSATTTKSDASSANLNQDVLNDEKRFNSFSHHHQHLSNNNKVLLDRSANDETSVPKYKGSILKYEMIPQLNFAGSKHDCKYQSLPYNSKFSKKNVNLIKNFASADGESHGKKYFLTDEGDTDDTVELENERDNRYKRSIAATATTTISTVCPGTNAGNTMTLMIKHADNNLHQAKENAFEERPSPSGSSGSSDRISSSLATYSYASHYDAYNKEAFNERERFQKGFDSSMRIVPNGSSEAKESSDETKSQVDSDNDKQASDNVCSDVVDKAANLLNHRKLYEQYIEREKFAAHQTKQPNSLEESPEKRTSPDENGNDDGENVRNVELEHRLSVSDLVDKMNTLSVAKDKDWKKNKRRAVFVTNEMEKELHQDMHDTSSNKTNSQDLLIKECEIIDSDQKNNNVVSLNTMHTRSNSLGNENKDKTQTTTASKRLKGSLKKCNDTKGKMPVRRRVSFDPLALLLDASLEGELELVKKTSAEVLNPSACNDEGITALHNATCASHFEIVKYLVEIGCDVNAQDSDGWTPLHCAASCNNLAMIKFLVQSGACIFATTFSDNETAAEKCEEDEEGFDGCSQYLYGVQDKLGIANGGLVYAVYDYEARNSDELTFKDGDTLQVLRKSDDREKDWWWSRSADQEGYIARNLLGLHPRIKPNKKGISSG